MSSSVRRGDRFVRRHPAARWPVFIEVTRVGRAGWVDIRCFTWAVSWAKRMPAGIEPMLEPGHEFHLEREHWTHADVEATAPEKLP